MNTFRIHYRDDTKGVEYVEAEWMTRTGDEFKFLSERGAMVAVVNRQDVVSVDLLAEEASLD